MAFHKTEFINAHAKKFLNIFFLAKYNQKKFFFTRQNTRLFSGAWEYWCTFSTH